MRERETLKINARGHLEIGGADCVDLAKSYGTPLYVFDEKHIREMMRVYRDTLNTYEGGGRVLYASKAFSCMGIYAIARQEHIGVDVVSGGELYTALKAGFPAEHITMHGNNKLDSELLLAVKNRVASIVVDSASEADRLDEIAKREGIRQTILVRVNPGVEAHTHAYVRTATPDSKFGFSVANGTAEETVKHLLTKKNLALKGIHCHIGSQIFEKQSFVVAAEKCLDFLATLKSDLGFEAEILNLGGGFGIYYADGDPELTLSDYRDFVETLISAVKDGGKKRNLKLPFLNIEPGRSIVGEAGITLYTVGAIKEIAGVKKYLAIDGGMFDNPRYCLYNSKYTAILANRAAEPPTEFVSIAGKCCESGDLIGENFNLPKANIGDVVAILSTGAYNYSMASNYNRNFIPPAILVSGGKAEYLVKPQNYEDLIRNDVVPSYLKKA